MNARTQRKHVLQNQNLPHRLRSNLHSSTQRSFYSKQTTSRHPSTLSSSDP